MCTLQDKESLRIRLLTLVAMESYLCYFSQAYTSYSKPAIEVRNFTKEKVPRDTGGN